MEHTSPDNHNSDTNFLLMSVIIITKFFDYLFSTEVKNTLEITALAMLIVINADKVIDISTKWYLRGKELFSKFKKK